MNFRVEFDEGEVPLDSIPERAKKYQPDAFKYFASI